MKIEDRITEHEILIEKLNNKRDIIKRELNKINEKIIFHNTAICNLQIKQSEK